MRVERAVPDRSEAVNGAQLLFEFLCRFGLNDFSEVGTAQGTWWLDEDEGGPEIEVVPDIDVYLEHLDWIARGRGVMELIFRCDVVGSARRLWVTVEYDREKRQWFYEYPGVGDDTELEAEFLRDMAEQDARAALPEMGAT